MHTLARRRLGLFGISCLVLLTSMPACQSARSTNPQFHATRQQQLDLPGRVHIDVSTTNGSIVVSQSPDADTTSINASAWLRTDSRARDFELSVKSPGGDSLVVRPQWPGGTMWHNETCDLEIIAPILGSVTIQTINGRIAITGGEGQTTIESKNGSIDITDRAGHAIARSHNGRIHATRVEGGLELRTSNGAIRIVQSRPGTPLGDRSDYAKWTIESGNGTISTELDAHANATLFASTGNGSVVARLHNGSTLPTTTIGERVSLRVGDGTGEILLRTGNGSITIIVNE